ncbi:ABC transporter substrate-binding protein [Rhodococcoides kyotonense]|uniref:Peptide/nickel transport system substrate-binding protein n=1 Tax=Rhodococcoides kyotonense TaxID=398843 RepID=A0A239GBL8_9NOCA|nr:ABC transporter substrate-binding protein [Rhodococcus kyotonensis]SNS66188.1 peptide/nickel transport system substrate-binding protein [Rhodococcus kyotonensis]
MKTQKVFTLAASAAVLSLTAACGGASTAPNADVGDPVSGGSIRYAVSAWPKCVDPALQARGLSASQQYVETLTDQDRTTGEVIPRLAESWEVSDAANSFTLTLRDGVTFSDGTPLTAEVVKANVDTLKQIADSGRADTPLISALNTYVGTTVVDDRIVRFDFGAPELGFLRNLSDPYFGIYASSTVASSYEERCAGTSLVATGPFVITDVVQGQKLELDRRDDYGWAPAGVTSHTGAGYVDSISFELIPESGVRVGGLQSGEFDIVDDVPVLDQDVVAAQGDQIITGLVPNLVPGLRQNPLSPLGSDVAVRQALQSGIDREEIRDTLYSDRYSLPSSAIASNTPLWADQSDGLVYDPDRSEKILADAGWAKDGDGIWAKDGTQLAPRITYTPGSTQGATQQELELIQQQLGRIGIKVQLSPITAAESSAYMKDKAAAPYDFLTGSGPAKDVDFLAGLFLKTNPALAPADQPELESAAKALNLAATDAEREEAAAALQKLLVDGGYWIPVREQTRAVGVSADIQGVEIDPYGGTVLYDAWKVGGTS